MSAPYKNSTKPYLYIQQPPAALKDYEPNYIFTSSLEACVKEVRADVAVNMKPGAIYVRYSRVAALLRERARLQARIAELEAINSRLADTSGVAMMVVSSD